MKKRALFILCALCLAGCSSETETVPTDTPMSTVVPATSEPVQEEETKAPVVATATPAPEQYAFDYNGTKVSVNDDLDSVLDLLGEAKREDEYTSEKYMGKQKVYTYSNVLLSTYPGDTKTYIKSISLLDDTYATEEGIKVGDLLSDVEDVYGDALTKESDYIYSSTMGETKVRFIILNESVAQIDYYRITTETESVGDETAPTIINPFELTLYTDQTLSDVDFRRYTYAQDDVDGDAKVVADYSNVDMTTCGDYEVTIYAFDEAGNVSEESTTYTVAEKPSKYSSPDSVDELADSLLDQIIEDDMTTTDKCTAIYKWIRGNFSYSNTSDKTDWVQAANTGLRKKSGDCFVYYSVAQELLYRAGIQSIRVQKNPGHSSTHYWSLVYVPDQGWYHFDTTPRKSGGEFDLVTDEFIQEYSRKHSDSHDYDTSKYPSTPTKDVEK